MKKNKLNNLSKTITAVVIGSLSALGITSVNSDDVIAKNTDDLNENSITDNFTKKTLPVLKLNLNNPLLSKLIAQHGSHSSHSSHSSHYSHSSHRSGGMFA